MAGLINTPEEYLSQTSYDLQTSLGIKDTKLLTSGTLSVLANMLSNVAFDAQKYYEYVVKEFNVATAQNFKSMLFHASVYSYDFNLALPSHVTTYIMIPKVDVPSNHKLRYTAQNFTSFTISNATFRIDGEINVEILSDSISATLTDGVGTYQLDIIEGVDSDNKPVYYITIPDNKVEQVQRMIDKFVVPSYNIGDNVSFNVTIPTGNQLYLMRAYVNSASNSSFNDTDIQNLPIDSINTLYPQLTPFDLKYFKFNTTSTEKIMFANLSNYQNITFTLGNGIYGYKLNTNDEVFAVVEYCEGTAGNVPAGTAQIDNVYFYEIDIDTNNTLIFNTLNLNVKTETPANGGLDASSIDDIRFGILKKITERNSLLTPLDFEKYFANPITNKLATVVSRQIDTSSPLVTVYNVLHDPYTFDKIKTVTLNIDSDECFTSDQQWCINPTQTYNNINMVSPFVYIKYDNKVYSYYMYKNIEIPLTMIEITSDPEIIPTLYIKWDSTENNFYFECEGVGSGFNLSISSSVGEYTLTSDNDYKVYISNESLIYDKFFDDELVINDVDLIDTSTQFAVHKYNVTDKLVVMLKIQKHKQYEFSDKSNKILFAPFIEQTYYDNFGTDSKYETNFVDFFTISSDDVNNKLAFNISLNQSFMNTIDVDPVSKNCIIENDNNELLSEYPVEIEVTYNANQLTSSGLTLIDLKTDINLAVLNYLNSVEGNKIEMYVTSIIKMIKNMYPEVVDEVLVTSPRTLIADSWTNVINLGKYTADQILNSSPTFYYFNVNNMNIKFTMTKTS